MSDPALSQREFDTWRESDETFKRQLTDYMQAQTELNLDVQGRVSSLEAHKGKSDIRAGTISSIVSAIVSTIVGVISGSTRL